MKLSVTHISDLHRDPETPIRNDVLLDSLETTHNEKTSWRKTTRRPKRIEPAAESKEPIFIAYTVSKPAETRATGPTSAVFSLDRKGFKLTLQDLPRVT
jgi:hypothetical protein